MIGEFELIKKLISGWKPGQDVVIGPGDDTSAVITGATDDTIFLQTTDLLVEGIHFRKGWGRPFQLGWKSLAVNLSDIAAMGGKPRHTHLSLAIPPTWPPSEILDLRDGFKALADQFKISLLGGDLSRSKDFLMIAGAASGTVPAHQVIRRSGARPGDVIWVSGPLGSAAAGLRLLKEGISEEKLEDFYLALLQPQPEVELGMLCASSGAVTAMIDLSDGLSGDLGHILEASNVGATLEEKDIPVSELLQKTASERGWELLELILQGGEDYRLLGCTPEAEFGEFCRLAEDRLEKSIFSIGHISDKPGLRLERRDGRCEDIPPTAHDHFAEFTP